MIASVFLNFLLSIICLLIFLKGYFPIKRNEPLIINPPNSIKSHKFNLSEVYKPSIDRLVLVIIDALREDFVTDDYMPYTIKEKSCLIPIKVEAPTVTLPRIKAITTGSMPQFVDIILNLGSTTKVEDSFLHRAHVAGKKMVFYGDNTWIKIYPDLFIRKDGTTSFYVDDFTEVDNNVTRHIENELENEDWDVLFLHYLGLDHIGHVKGPFSELIKPKLREMDEVIRRLNEAAKTWKKTTLLLVTGDHGMKDSGGHGGTTHAETHVPLISFGSTCGERLIAQQTDIPVTLSALFALQMHANSIGKIIPDFFTSHDTNSLLYIMYYNLIILSNHSESCEQFEDIKEIHSNLFRKYDNSTANYLYQLYQGCLTEISTRLIRSSVEQDINLLLFALMMTITCLFFMVHDYIMKTLNQQQNLFNVVIVYSSTIIFWVLYHLNIFLIFFFLYQIVLAAYAAFKFIKILFLHIQLSNNHKPYILLIIIHGILLQSSSFVEEEHQIWYFYTGTVSVVLLYFSYKYSFKTILSVIASLRFLRTLNSTGDAWASYPDIADWLLLEGNFIYLQLFYLLGLLLTLQTLITISKGDYIQKVLYLFTLLLTFLYKMHFQNVTLGKCIWGMIIITSCRNLKFTSSLPLKLSVTWILIISLLVRPYNAILIPSCIMFSHLYTKFITGIDLLAIVHMWLGYTLFFCQGHSNSIASVDISSAYIGLNSYIPVLVLCFTLFHTYAFPILSMLLLLTKYPTHSSDIFTLNIINRLWVLIVIYIMVLVQRGHLFVWSVFAPKLLVEGINTLVLFLQICCYYILRFVPKFPIKTI